MHLLSVSPRPASVLTLILIRAVRKAWNRALPRAYRTLRADKPSHVREFKGMSGNLGFLRMKFKRK